MKSKFTLLSIILMTLITGAFAVPMNGTYTIGGVSPSFTTIRAAMDTLFARGVNGPVIFDIRPGTYNGQINVSNIAGTSATNTITIKSENNDSTSVILTDTASISTGNFVFHVYGADYLTLKNVTLYRIDPTGSIPNCTVINLATNSRYFKLIGCIVKNDYVSGSAEEQALVWWTSGSGADSLITFDNNIFINGSYGIYMTGQNANSHFVNPSVTNNEFQSQSLHPVHFLYATAPVITNNTFVISSSIFGYTSVYLSRVLGATNISNNIMTGIFNGNGISLDSVIGGAGAPVLISNNFIQMSGTNNTIGIYYYDTRRVNTYYNSIYNTSANTSSAAVSIENSGDSALNFRNNIMVSTNGGITFNVNFGVTGAIGTSDYNDLYVAGSANLAYYDTGYAITLTDWQTVSAQDANSVSGDPLFISDSDLHSGSPVVNNSGVVIPSVTTDIDGEARSNTTPDIGADEFTPLSNNLASLTFILPSITSCGDSLTTVSIIIKNLGLDPQTGFDVVAELSGMLTDTLIETYSGSIASNTTDTVIFTTTVNTYAGGTLDIKAYASLATDQYNDNDTISYSFEFLPHPATPTIASPQTVCDNSVMITGTPVDTADVLVWYDQPTGGNLLFVGNTFSPAITTDTTFYAESHTGSGGTGCLRITEIQGGDNPSDFAEITNISGVGFDATGWTVLASNVYANINSADTVYVWNLDYMPAGSVRFRTDNATDTNYWGNNLLFENGNTGWAMIIDSNHNVIDFVAWEWDSASIASMAVPFDLDTIYPGTFWSGNGVVTCSLNTLSMQRIGTDDNDNASDWICEPVSAGVMNTNLSSTFSHCGIGLCGSVRVPVSVLLTAGVTPVNIGNDTIISNIDSLLLDAGSGYNSYLWSTGDTVQTIWAVQGTYWVIVTGGASNCIYGDTININSPVAINTTLNNDDVVIYPNPANNRLIVTATAAIMQNSTFRITDVQGREQQLQTSNNNGQIIFNLENLSNGMYYLQIISGNKSGVKKFTILK